MKHKIYVTTSIPYVNAAPHVGFALELVQADAIARFHRLCGREVRFQTGTDENAIKNVLTAAEQDLTTQELVDRNSQRYRELLGALDISADSFLRTTKNRHHRGVHTLWRSLRDGDIYRKTYRGLYCTGCEDFYLEKDLLDGTCPEHGTKPVDVAEDNYFFHLSVYQQQIEELLTSGQLKVVPETRRNEVLSFVRRGLVDISVSRAATRTGGWGIRVPGDDSQVVYVWIDALVNYISGPGFGSGDDWRDWWNDEVQKIHVIGKNVWKFHAVYWPAMLLSAGLPLSDKVVVHGFVTVEGKKIGKSLGNAVDPFACLDAFGTDAVRYYLLRSIPPWDDGDFSLTRLRELYTADLANGLGNLVSRLTSLCQRTDLGGFDPPAPPVRPAGPGDYLAAFERGQFDKAAAALWRVVDDLNQQIETARPWELLKAPDHSPLRAHLRHWLTELHRLAYWLAPLLPTTSTRILDTLRQTPLRASEPLFPRLAK